MNKEREYENQLWLDNYLKLKAKQEQKDFNNLAKVKERITALHFSQLGLKDEVIIEDYPDLKQLNLGNNKLSKVTIRNCPDLKLVAVAHNQLTKLVIENCPSVQEIYTHNNQLTKWDFPVEELKSKNLRTISYSDNPLTAEEKARLDALGLEDTAKRSRVDGPAQDWFDAKYPLAERDKVEKLDLSNLGLQGELKLEGFVNLKKLDCSDNDLTGLNLEQCEKLKYLECSNNRNKKTSLANLDLSWNKNLQEVYANHCGLEKVNLTGLDKIKSLSLTSNNLKSLDLKTQVNLLYLNVGLNKLKTLDLTNNAKIKSLLCYINNLSELKVKHLSELESLYCYKNFFRKMDCSGLKKLEEVYIFGGIPVLNLWLKEINVNDCEALQILDCAENRGLKTLIINDLPNLLTLSLRQCGVSKLVINNCKKLEYLDFSRQKSVHRKNKKIQARLVVIKADVKGSDNLKKVFHDKGVFVPDWEQQFPNLELVGVGEEKKVKEKNKEGVIKDVIRYFVEETDFLTIRNTNKINHILNNPDNYTFDDLLNIDKKQLWGVDNDLRQKLMELAQKKLHEHSREQNQRATELLKRRVPSHFLIYLLKELDFNFLEPDLKIKVQELIAQLEAEEKNKENIPPQPEKKRKTPSPEEDKQNDNPSPKRRKKDKDQIILALQQKIAELEKELENGKGNAEKRKEEIRNEITNSDISEEQKEELLKQLEGLTKKTTTNEVEIPSSTPLYYWGWLFVIVGWIVLLGLFILSLRKEKRRKYK